MARGSHRLLFLLLGMAICCGPLLAQAVVARATDDGKIIVRMLDAKTGHLIPTSDFLIRVDHEDEMSAHANWVTQNEDGTGALTLPANAIIVSIQGKYNSSTEIYVNCDSVEKNTQPFIHWYKVAEILKTGIIAPNNCSKLKDIAKPGEFVFFVRKLNFREQYKDFQP
jgi:hypothetical protein